MDTVYSTSLPLIGKRIILLRSLEQSQELSQKLAKLGAKVILFPMIEIVPDRAILDLVDESYLETFTTVIFTSTNGVKVFIEALLNRKIPLELISTKEILAIGPKTSEALQEYGIVPNAIPKIFVAEKVLDLFPSDLKLKKILIPAAAGARKVLTQELEKRGAYVKLLPIYSNRMPKNGLQVEVEKGDFVIFTSPSTAHHFFQTNAYSPTKPIYAFCIGEITKNAVSKYLNDHIYVSESAVTESLIECILEHK